MVSFSSRYHHETFSMIHDWNFDILVHTPGKFASAPLNRRDNIMNDILIESYEEKLTSDSP